MKKKKNEKKKNEKKLEELAALASRLVWWSKNYYGSFTEIGPINVSEDPLNNLETLYRVSDYIMKLAERGALLSMEVLVNLSAMGELFGEWKRNGGDEP